MIGYSISRLSSISSNVLRKIPQNIGINTVRHGHRMRGKPPGIARSITQRLEGIPMLIRLCLHLHLSYVFNLNLKN